MFAGLYGPQFLVGSGVTSCMHVYVMLCVYMLCCVVCAHVKLLAHMCRCELCECVSVRVCYMDIKHLKYVLSRNLVDNFLTSTSAKDP